MTTRKLLTALLLTTIFFVSCSNEDETIVGPTDTIPPEAIADLVAGSPSGNSITLTWTAPGDDGNVAKAREYDLRYSTSVITSENFSSANQFTGAPVPTVCGEEETCQVTDLNPTTTYYFAIKAADEVPNWSGISNVAQATTHLSGNWTVYTTENSPLTHNTVNAIQYWPGSGMYFGTDSALAGLYSQTWVIIDSANSDLVCDNISALTVDGSGYLWIGTRTCGVSVYNGYTFTTYDDTNSDLSNTAIQSIAVSDANDIWIATLGGLFNVQTDTIINLNASNSDLLSNLLSCVAFDSDGNLWVGYNFNGASRYNGSSFEHFDGGDGFTSLGVASIFVASNNAVWFGTEEGVFVYSGGSWLNYNTSNSDLVSNVILSITQDHSGDIWLATPSGICRFDGSSASGWTHYTTENSMLPDNLVRVVAPDATGNMWIGTDNGLAAFYD